MDSMAAADLCRKERIMTFPTLRWYEDGRASGPDYKMDRTVEALVSYSMTKSDIYKRKRAWLQHEIDGLPFSEGSTETTRSETASLAIDEDFDDTEEIDD
jgi:hypothetical protein